MKIHRFNPLVDGETVFMHDRPNGSVILVKNLLDHLIEIKTLLKIQLEAKESPENEAKLELINDLIAEIV